MAARKKIRLVPHWTGVFEQWSHQWVIKNYWRVKHVHGSHEDSLQEAAVVFARCVKAYSGRVDNPAWFMALYKRAVINEWHRHSVRDTKVRDLATDFLDDEESALQVEAMDMASTHWGEITAHLKGCGGELLDALANIAMAPAELVSMLARGDRRDLVDFLDLDHHNPFVVEAARRFAEVYADHKGSGAQILNDLCEILNL
jgi:hypothetical protein